MIRMKFAGEDAGATRKSRAIAGAHRDEISDHWAEFLVNTFSVGTLPLQIRRSIGGQQIDG